MTTSADPMAGSDATQHVFRTDKKYPTWNDCLWPDGFFGTQLNVTFTSISNWNAVPDDYLQWIPRQQDMNEDVVHTARHHLAER